MEKEKFSVKKCAGYGLYLMTYNMTSVFVGYLTYYATDSLFLSAAAISLVLGISRLFDGITDVLAGVIIERTNTKYGKARPYLLCGAGAYLAMAFMFATPDLSDTGKLVWIFITYNLNTSIFTTIFNILNATLLSRMAVKQENRVKFLSYGSVISNIGNTGVNVILPIVISKAANDAAYWTYMALTLGVLGVVLSVIIFMLCKEYTDEELVEMGVITKAESCEKVSFKLMIVSVVKNKYFLMFLLAYFVMAFQAGTQYTISAYWYTWVLGNILLLSTISMINIVSWPLNAVYPKIMKKMGAAKFVQCFMVLCIVGSLLRYIPIFTQNIVLLYLTSFCTSMGIGVLFLVGPEITVQCMEYSRLKNGIRVEGIYNSFVNFMFKIGMALGTAALGLVLELGGYDGSLAVQSEKAISTINLVMNVFPAVACTVIFILFAFIKVEKANKELTESKKLEEK